MAAQRAVLGINNMHNASAAGAASERWRIHWATQSQAGIAVTFGLTSFGHKLVHSALPPSAVCRLVDFCYSMRWDVQHVKILPQYETGYPTCGGLRHSMLPTHEAYCISTHLTGIYAGSWQKSQNHRPARQRAAADWCWC